MAVLQRLPVTLIDPYDSDFWVARHQLISDVEDSLSEGTYTPDFPQLCEKQYHYIFVYGTLKKGFKNDRQLEEADIVGCGFTVQDRFMMAIEKKAKFPIAFFDNREEYRSRLYGEIYQVEPAVIRSLDYLESNGVLYKRFPLFVEMFNKTGFKQKIRAWTYIGLKDWWSSRTDRLIPAKRFRPNDSKESPYFIFTKQDE